MKKISCIIPAYNEGSRIEKVLSVVSECDFLDEIIVVDDFSKDNTASVVEKFNKVKLIRHQVNKGKSISIYDGVKNSSGEILLFLDADLIGLTKENIRELVENVSFGKSDISISLRGNAPFLWKLIKLDYISGERCFTKSLFEESLENIKSLRGFGLEVFLNKIIIKKSLRLKIVFWQNVESPFKRKKFGINWDFIVMGINIFKEISPIEAVMQIIKMKKLSV